jgi:hypothetical protein
MSTTRFTTDQYEDRSITSSKLVTDISIPSIAVGSGKLIQGDVTKNGSTLTGTKGMIYKYGDIDMIHVDENGNMYIKGNLEIGGEMNSVTTTVNTLEVGDSEIILNSGVSEPFSGGAKISVDRGGSNYHPYVGWDETNKYWILYDGTNTGRVVDQTFGDARYVVAGGTTSGSITSIIEDAIILKSTGMKSWVIKHPAENKILFAPSMSINGIDWDLTKQVVLTDTGGIQISGGVTVTGDRIDFGSGSFLDNVTEGVMNFVGNGAVCIYPHTGTNNSLYVTPTAVAVYNTSEDYSRLVFQFDGKLGFGPGTATRDTWLYRDGTNSLKTDGVFHTGGDINVPAGYGYRVNNNWVIGQEQTTNIIHIGSESVANDIQFCSSTGAGIIMVKANGNLGIGNVDPQQKLDVTGNGHITGNLVVDGAITGNIILSSFKYARITYPAGKSTATFTHNLGTTDYIVQITPNSPETHFYYSNRTANSVSICLDDPAYEQLDVDVVVIKYDAITSITATV